MITRQRTSIEKFEEFFATSYKDDVFEILETYPDNRSLTVDYNLLELYDQDLADLLIDKPEEVIEAMQIAIKNIDPLAKDADLNIHFKNITKFINFQDIDSTHIGTLISTKCAIEKINHPKSLLQTAIFECRGCMRLHEVEQTF